MAIPSHSLAANPQCQTKARNQAAVPHPVQQINRTVGGLLGLNRRLCQQERDLLLELVGEDCLTEVATCNLAVAKGEMGTRMEIFREY